MAKRKKRGTASRSSRKKRAPLKRRTAAKRRTTAKRRTATKRRESAKRQSAAKPRTAPRRSNASKRSQSDPRVRGDIMLVGSLPFETVEEGLRAVGSKLGDDVIAIPDGEVGPRKMWCMFLATDTYSKHRDLVESRRPSPAVISNEEKPVGDKKTRPGAAPEYHWTFRVKDGVKRLDLGELGYAAAARESYATFCRLRDEGVIASGPRFQVSLVATDSGTNVYFDDATTWPIVHAAYAKAMKAEIAKMLEMIPPDDLAIQLDLAWEVVDLSIGDEQYFPWWPQSTLDEKFERYMTDLVDLASGIPEAVPLGLHWCYGTWGGWPMTEMPNLELCVRLSNEAVKRIKRRVDYVHMPVVPDPDDAFLAPLHDLDIGTTRVFLGLIHPQDGLEGAKRRIGLAKKYLNDFGIAAVCGFGRENPHELGNILELHKAAARSIPG
jgi:hypothetical protein